MEDWAEGVLGSVCVDGAEGVLEQVERWEVCLRLLENLSLELLGQLQSLLEDRRLEFCQIGRFIHIWRIPENHRNSGASRRESQERSFRKNVQI
ncbi:hypothetical protein MHYP_G00264460 [Metynnis hypsauchen]